MNSQNQIVAKTIYKSKKCKQKDWCGDSARCKHDKLKSRIKYDFFVQFTAIVKFLY